MTTHMLEHNQIYVPWRAMREKGVWNITEVTMHRAASGYSLVFSRSANYVFFLEQRRRAACHFIERKEVQRR